MMDVEFNRLEDVCVISSNSRNGNGFFVATCKMVEERKDGTTKILRCCRCEGTLDVVSNALSRPSNSALSKRQFFQSIYLDNANGKVVVVSFDSLFVF